MVDPFSVKRLRKFVEDFRNQTGQYATLKDITQAQFDEATLKEALKKKAITQLYVTMTSGAVVKGYKSS